MKLSFIPLSILASFSFSLLSCKKNTTDNTTGCGALSDIDGNMYNSIQIGTQCWMQENLNVSHYNNGDSIPEVTDSSVWVNLTTGAWCYYENISADGAVYGKLYNWYAVNDSRGLAPAGWHVPADSEWTILSNNLGGGSVAGDKIKEAGTAHWTSVTGNTGTNSSGFTALPGGYRSDYNGIFLILGQNAFWWSITQTTNGVYAWNRYIQDEILASTKYKTNGFSVRCIKN